MNIIFGFGRTEQDFEEQEFNFVNEFVIKKAKEFQGDKYNFYFDDKLIEDLRKVLSKRSKKYKKLDEQYKNAKTYPDRYSYYYPTVVYDMHNICVVFNFNHINRHHAFSPDGWALMSDKKVCYIDIWDMRDNYCKLVEKGGNSSQD